MRGLGRRLDGAIGFLELREPAYGFAQPLEEAAEFLRSCAATAPDTRDPEPSTLDKIEVLRIGSRDSMTRGSGGV